MPLPERLRASRWIVLLLLVLLLVAAVAGYFWLLPDKQPAAGSYQACVDAGNPVQESYPEVCVTPDGRQFTNPEQQPFQPPANESTPR